jgi:ribonuclease P protein component
MLPKTKRITTTDFKGIKTRLIYRGAFFDVSVATTPTLLTTKFACVVSKKRIRRAVDRNKARRKVYSLLSAVETPLPTLVFVYPTKTILKAPFPELQSEIRKAFATL